MYTKPTEWAEVDEQGRLVLPAGLAAQYGLAPGARVRLDPDGNHLRLHRPVTQLAKLYVEPTTACNLDCITCFRNAWDEPMGRMSDETFGHVLAGLKALDPAPTVYFGGIGEPLFHPRTVGWIAQVKALGARAELITNGTLLNEARARELIASGLDLLWVSIDGATPESFADVRLGAELPQVLANLSLFRKLRKGSHYPRPQIGIAFVAMRRNIAELPEVLKLGRALGAKHFSVSNIEPVTASLQADRLYASALADLTYLPTAAVPHLSLPKMDFDAVTSGALAQAFSSGYNVSFAGNNFGGANDVCNYIESGSMSIAWDGAASPCWPLMHAHRSYLHGKPRRSRRHVIGNVAERSLADLWLDPGYVAYRERVQSFAFAPCTFCGGCDLSEANEEDCLGNTFPACGGCLWAQGVIQCP
jgi:MoaA/NifB/PqqE/SkfB family radical SAM enzyme